MAGRLRPRWHQGIKWAAAIVLFLVLQAVLVLYNLVQMTAEGPAVETMTIALATLYSPGGLDDPTDIAAALAVMQASPEKRIKPIPGLNISLTYSDVVGRPAREARLKLFRQLATPLYREGAEGLAALAETDEMRQSMAGGAGPLGLISAATHRSLQRGLRNVAIVALVLLLPLVLCSAGFGRLLSPGWVLLFAGLPGALFTRWAQAAIAAMPPPVHPAQGGGIMGMVGLLFKSTGPPLLRIMGRSYAAATMGGAVLLAMAAAGWLAWWLVQVRRARAVGPGGGGLPLLPALFGPLWRDDARWGAGLLLFLALQGTLLTYALFRMTAEQPAMAALGQYAGLATPLTRAVHARLQRPLTPLALGALLFAAALVYFSTGFRRLSNPGWALFLATLPWGPITMLAASGASGRPPQSGEGSGPGGMAVAVVGSALPPLVRQMADVYRYALVTGLGLIAVGAAGGLVWWLVHRLRARRGRSAAAT